jgi:hypothetical protein
MKSHHISRIDKCQPLSPVHRFGTNGTPIEPELGAILPCSAQDVNGVEHHFNIQADILEGDHTFLIGCPTLMALKEPLEFDALNLDAANNGTRAILIYRSGIYYSWATPRSHQFRLQTVRFYHHQPSLGQYEIPSVSPAQFCRIIAKCKLGPAA